MADTQQIGSAPFTRRGFLKTAAAAGAAWTLQRLLPEALLAAEGTKRPNILLILDDDMGAECLGCYGSTSYRTPNLDALAQGGIRFENAYCTPLCTPTRVELMTGRYPFRTGWINLIGRVKGRSFLDPKADKNFAQMLKEAGYATAVAGKWQLADFAEHPNHPNECGFDEYCLWAWQYQNKGTARYWDPFIWQDGKKLAGTEGKYGPDIYCRYLIDFMRRNKDKPFLAYYPMCLTHAPFHPTPDDPASHATSRPGEDEAEGDGEGGGKAAGKAPLKGAEKAKAQAQKAAQAVQYFPGMVAYADKQVGELLAELDRLGLRENTLVIFAGDNGTDRPIVSRLGDRQVKGGKGTVTELGCNVPFIVSWKGAAPAGVVSQDMIDFSDVMPTLAEVCGGKLPQGVKLDGVSFAPILKGGKGARPWAFCMLGNDWFIRDPRWLLRKDGSLSDVTDRYAPRPADDGPQARSARKRLQDALDDLMPSPEESAQTQP